MPEYGFFLTPIFSYRDLISRIGIFWETLSECTFQPQLILY